MRILFAGGGTGGHFFPILAVIRELKRVAEEERILNLELYYTGPDTFGRDLLMEEGVIPLRIFSGKLRTYFSLLQIIDAIQLVIGIFQALWAMFRIMPDIVFSKGGYGALPAVIGAALFRIPIIIHESDSIPGKVNVFSARFAKRIGVAFPSAAAYFPERKTAYVGVPIRKRILGGNIEGAKKDFNIYSKLPVVGIFGASQGAEKLNTAVLGALREMTEKFEVVHQTGEKNFKNVAGEASVILESGHKDRYRAFGFMDEFQMRGFYGVCDVIVARAGASTIFEIAAWGKPAILVPLKIAAQDHQRKNAYDYGSTGAATIIEEENLTPHILLQEVARLVGDTARMKEMSRAAQAFARIDSAELIAKEILKLGVHNNGNR